MNVLQIVIKNTSTMDFTVPVLKEIKEKNQNINVSVLYCVMSRGNILRKSTFWDKQFEDSNIVQIDYCNHLKWPWTIFEKVIRKFFSGSKHEKIYIREVWRLYIINAKKASIVGFIIYLLKEYSILEIFGSLAQTTISFIERLGVRRLVDISKILPAIKPDFILFDNRALINFPGRDEIYQWMYRNKVKVGLLPHAPHLRDPLSEFCPFDEKGEALPDFCEFWVPLKFGTPWLMIPKRKDQFYLTGYPGLDSEWLSWCKDGMGEGKSLRGPREPIRCLFVMRRYLPKGEKRPDGMDPYIIDYEEFANIIKSLIGSFNNLGLNVNLILKPHPANSYKILKKDLLRMGVKNWEISQDSIYQCLSKIDLVVGLFSTVLLIPAMAGIPTILIKTKLLTTVHSEWPFLEEIYSNMPYYVEHINNLSMMLERAIKSIESEPDKLEIMRLRNYYEDGSIGRVCARII
jgi:hypothetical protein